MQSKRELGKSGISITPLMLGTNVLGWNVDEKTSFAILDAFVDQRGNAIDTADVYSAWAPGHKGGESESVIGRWFKASGKRGKVVIATKAGMLATRVGIKRDNIIAACEDSLTRLQTDAIDLYQLHRDDEVTAPDEYLGALDALHKAGKVRAIGASNFKAGRFSEAMAASGGNLPRFSTLQPEYNLLAREIEVDLMPICVREGVSLIPYYGLANGYLSGKYRSPADKAKSASRGSRMDKYMEGKGPAVLAALDAIGARIKATPAQIALAWIMAKPAIAAPIASATSVSQLTELMGALQVTLSTEDIAVLDRASA